MVLLQRLTAKGSIFVRVSAEYFGPGRQRETLPGCCRQSPDHEVYRSPHSRAAFAGLNGLGRGPPEEPAQNMRAALH